MTPPQIMKVRLAGGASEPAIFAQRTRRVTPAVYDFPGDIVVLDRLDSNLCHAKMMVQGRLAKCSSAVARLWAVSSDVYQTEASFIWDLPQAFDQPQLFSKVTRANSPAIGGACLKGV